MILRLQDRDSVVPLTATLTAVQNDSVHENVNNEEALLLFRRYYRIVRNNFKLMLSDVFP